MTLHDRPKITNNSTACPGKKHRKRFDITGPIWGMVESPDREQPMSFSQYVLHIEYLEQEIRSSISDAFLTSYSVLHKLIDISYNMFPGWDLRQNMLF